MLCVEHTVCESPTHAIEALRRVFLIFEVTEQAHRQNTSIEACFGVVNTSIEEGKEGQ